MIVQFWVFHSVKRMPGLKNEFVIWLEENDLVGFLVGLWGFLSLCKLFLGTFGV